MFKTIKSILKLITLAGVIIYGSVITPEIHNQYLRVVVGESVVQVLPPYENGGGTGFAIKGESGEDYIMTNRHVCEVSQNEYVRIKTKDSEFTKKILYKDTVHDLCLIQGVDGLSPISLGSDPEVGSLLYVVGHPGLRKLTISSGEYIGKEVIELPFEVKYRDQCLGRIIELPPLAIFLKGVDFICLKSFDSLATSAVMYSGNSGSPVVNKFGNLIGVVFVGNRNQERDNYLIPLFYVKSILNNF